MSASKSTDIQAAWIDTSIHDFLLGIDDPPASMAYALITCLDSTFDVASVVRGNPGFAAVNEHGTKTGKGIVISTRRLIAIEARTRMFYGFDEIWFAPKSNLPARPQNLTLVGPERISAEMARRAARWMRESGVTLGLGDGCGMNFCAKLQGVAKFLVESYSESQSGAGKAIA